MSSEQIKIAVTEIEKRVKQKVECFCVRFDDFVLDETVESLKKIQFINVLFRRTKPKQIIVSINYNKLNRLQKF